MENKFVFNREKLEALEKELEGMPTVNPTADFWEEEMKRCEDPRYFFNNYWLVDGRAPNPISQEEWDAWQKKIEAERHIHFQRRKFIVEPIFDIEYRIK